MQDRRRFKQLDPLDKRLSGEAERLRKEARGVQQAYSQGAACGNRRPNKRVAFLARLAVADVTKRRRT
jgi:hypothetical protein